MSEQMLRPLRMPRDKSLDILRAAIVGGVPNTIDAINDLLSGQVHHDYPLDSSPVSFLTAAFDVLTEEQRQILRQALVGCLDEYRRSIESWSDERLASLLYILQRTRCPRLERDQVRRLILAAAEDSLTQGRTSHTVLLLGVAADERLIVRVSQWERYFHRLGTDVGVPCFIGIAYADLGSAFRWLDQNYSRLNLDHLAAGALPVIVKSAGPDAVVRAIDTYRAALRLSTVEFILGAVTELTGAEYRAVLPSASPTERVRSTILSLADEVLSAARRLPMPSRSTSSGTTEITIADIRSLDVAGNSPRDVLALIAPLNDSEIRRDDLERILEKAL